MNKTITACLVALIALGLGFIASPLEGAVSNPVPGVASANASGDLISTQLPYAAKIKGIKVNPITGGKYYQLKVGNALGPVVYRTDSAATTGTMVLDSVSFIRPSAGLYFQTNDTGSTITVYSE